MDTRDELLRRRSVNTVPESGLSTLPTCSNVDTGHVAQLLPPLHSCQSNL